MGSKETKEPKPKVAKFCLTRWPDLPVGTDPNFDAVDKLAKYVFENSYPDVATLRQKVLYYQAIFGGDLPELTFGTLEEYFLAILGSTGEIRQFSMELLKEKINCFTVNKDSILEVACAYPKRYPDDILLVIGKDRAFRQIKVNHEKGREMEMIACLDDPSWEREFDKETEQPIRNQLKTSEEFGQLLESLMTKHTIRTSTIELGDDFLEDDET